MAEPEKFSISKAALSLATLPPPALVQGPRPHRVVLGDSTLTFISDGAMSTPFRALAPTAPPGALEALFGLSEAPERGRGELTHLIIDRGAHRVLIETGAGPNWQTGAGRLLRHLKQNRIAPESVTHVVLTHLHPDHAWGTVLPDGSLAFPNAIHVIGRTEARVFGDSSQNDTLSPAAKPVFLEAQRILHSVGDKLQLVAEGDEVVGGLSVLDTPGHTPGHISLMLADGPGLIVTGDAVVNDIISFAEPGWSFGFDMDTDRSEISRRRLLDLAADGDHLMCGYHWNWPGIGRAEKAGRAYRFVPAG